MSFFTDLENQIIFKKIIQTLQNQRNSFGELDLDYEKTSRRNELLCDFFQAVLSTPDNWELYCPYNIRTSKKGLLNRLNKTPNEDVWFEIFAQITGFFVEYYIKNENLTEDEIDLYTEIIDFSDMNAKIFPDDAQNYLRKVRYKFPVEFTKEWRRDVKEASAVSVQIGEWKNELDSKEERVRNLKEKLDQYQTGFNFVGLHKGFDNLLNQKKNEVNGCIRNTVLFGVMIFLPFATELALFFFLSNEKLALVTGNSVISIALIIAGFTITGVFIYFFRLAVHRSQALKAQILQIELRKALCEFIQSYSGYAAEIKSKDPMALAKFEDIIFSNILSGEGQILSTFDGLDKLGGLIQSFRGSSK